MNENGVWDHLMDKSKHVSEDSVMSQKKLEELWNSDEE